MITTLTGENAYARQEALDALVTAFVSEHGDIALERIDGEEAGYEHIREALTSLPFLAAKKLVVLRAPGADKAFIEKSEELLGSINDTTDVIVVEPKLDKRLGYYKFLKKATDFREFAPLDTAGLASWLTGQAKERGGQLSAADARFLVDRVGPNQQLLASELDKLLLYDVKVTREHILLLTEPTPQSTVFELLEAAFAGKPARALALYDEQRALRVEPQQIVAMLAWQLHILALLKTAGERSPDTIAKEAKISPYVARKSQGIARSLTLSRLKKLISDLASIDERSKRSALDLDEALQNYLLFLAN